MLLLIVLLAFGLGVSYFAMQNTAPVTLTILGAPFPQVPLFFVVVGSILVGFIVAYIVYVIHSVKSGVTIWGKDRQINDMEQKVLDLETKVSVLEIENEELKSKKKSSRSK